MESLIKAQQGYASYGITTVQDGFVAEELATCISIFNSNRYIKY